mmetsp:Transcript_22332/g.55283  ORF Transcript_22332/g.55283 Transcript_22332/m.55283 type:complete len:120 (+) Transcript_22332:1315-1674(+)
MRSLDLSSRLPSDSGKCQPSGSCTSRINFLGRGRRCVDGLSFYFQVYQWAIGTPFKDICELTDIQEGSIVRCLNRLIELLRETKDALHVIGDFQLQEKLVEASDLIKRDIIFVTSLYLQ